MNKKKAPIKTIIVWIITALVVAVLTIGYLNARGDKERAKGPTEAPVRE
ncbi:MAG TPA: hypothetical protein PLK12_10735 [Prolixibacteraceae bacterium]|nr:hypothetical protein [Prolixibacteraceae bacterium]